MTHGSTTFSTADFDYDVPAALIAQRPRPDREGSRLLHLDRRSGSVRHGAFKDLPELLRPEDLLVLNTSRVIPARLRGVRHNGAPAEVLLVRPDADGTWIAMVYPGGKLKAGRSVRFGDAARLEIIEVLGGGLRRVRAIGLDWHRLIEAFGTVPLPPYIDRAPDDEDQTRYQTVYARVDGSVAAPTAGLHFTPELLRRIAAQGTRMAEVVLHVGPGTFTPVVVEEPAEHRMHAEWYRLPEDTVAAIDAARDAGGRIWAVGTTVTRVLEAAVRRGPWGPGEGWTDLFIYPPYDFRVVDALITNFHLPRSTLLMLVCAFAGRDRVLSAYRMAVAEGYRLYSYGDAMAVV